MIKYHRKEIDYLKERWNYMRKTKIVCTLGPATDREGVLREMLLAGMNVARFNFSHGSHEEHKARLDQLKALREELNLPVAAMLDTKGPEIRLKNFKNDSVRLKTGQEFTLTTEDIEGDEKRCAITYAELPDDVKEGDTILLDDGLVRLTVLESGNGSIRCRVENDGTMKSKKGVNVPNVRLSMPYMSQRDRDDILFGVERALTILPPASSARLPTCGSCGICWTSTTPTSASSPRSRTRRASATCRTFWRWPTASWWPGATWAWRSTSRRSPSSRRI